MRKLGFDNNKYLAMQSDHIRERISQFGDKLYLEFGGKLFDDYHASRVLPGFEPDSKLRMLMQLSDQAEIIIAVSAADITKNKIRYDLGITYDVDVLRLIHAFTDRGLYVGSVVITHYSDQPAILQFKTKLEKMGIRVYRHYTIDGYPSNIPLIVSDDGFGKNDYIETERPLVVVTAPGPGSGKMATCLSQLYHENKRGIKAGYAKFETFPVWNLPLKHPVNLAFEGIFGECPYKSPTDMGVNMNGFCIMDDEACREASRQEIIRRYYQALGKIVDDESARSEAYKIELIMKQAKITPNDRPVVPAALSLARSLGAPAAALELPDGKIVLGKTKELLGASAAVLLNAIKELGGIDHDLDLISPESIAPIQELKVRYLGSTNPRLHTDEVLIALSTCAATDQNARTALEQLPKLRGCQVHTSVLLSDVDTNIFKKLGIELTCEPVQEDKK